jgi:DNA polymerase-3 subunit delta'
VPFASVPEQPAATRLLEAALADDPAHAFLFHGPRGVGKRAAAVAFAGALLGDARRVEGRSHPDLRVVEALGDMIRIDAIRELHHDLHMRPFEADRRVYLLFDAQLLNEDAADALLKDLEEPPAYATIVLVADELGPLPETIRSRCQLVPFRRLPERAVLGWIGKQEPELAGGSARAVARIAAGRLDRAARLLDPAARERRAALVAGARATYLDDAYDPAAGARVVLDAMSARGVAASEREQAAVADLDLPTRDAEQRVRRAQRGAEKEELLASLEELETWFRDLVVVGAGVEGAAAYADRLDDLRADAPLVGEGAVAAAEAVRDAWRVAEEFNVNAGLWLEAALVNVRRAVRPVRSRPAVRDG